MADPVGVDTDPDPTFKNKPDQGLDPDFDPTFKIDQETEKARFF